MRLKDLTEKFIVKQNLRIKIYCKFVCDTVSDSEIAELYQDYFVVLIEAHHENRDGLPYVYLVVWLSKEKEKEETENVLE